MYVPAQKYGVRSCIDTSCWFARQDRPDFIHEAGGFWMPVLHPFLTGRLTRLRELEHHLERIVEQGDVWFAPMKEIAIHAKAHGASLRHGTLDFRAPIPIM